MAFDGFVTHKIVCELCDKLTFGKIDKVQMPEKDEIVLSVRTREGVFRVLFSAASSNPRLHLTEKTKENPLTAPLFCMILRKHLTGGKLKRISQCSFDRVVKLDIECYTEMGDLTEKSLIIEIMGRHSNIILVNHDGKIIDCIKHIDFTTSGVRQVLPGLFYELPPAQDKTEPGKAEGSTFAAKLSSLGADSSLDKLLLSEYMGMSPIMAKEIVFRHTKTTKEILSNVNISDFAEHTLAFFKEFFNSPYIGYVALDKDTNRPIAFSCVRLTQYDGLCTIKECSSISEAVETYFSVRDMQDRLVQKAASTIKIINNNLDRCQKKIVLHTENIRKAADREKHRMYGDLLTSNLYRMKDNLSSVVVQNHFSESLEDIEIPLKPELSPSKNAQRYYKLYSKAKATEEHSTLQLKEALEERDYLESVLDSLSRITDYADILEIREELAEQGYITISNSKKNKNKKKSLPMEFTSSDGYTILVGRNNKQNDELTIKTAYSTDIWLHTKQIPGSHVIIRTNGTGETSDNTLVEAAKIAAYFSKAQKATSVPVDYTQVKNIRKPNGSKPGFVIYKTNYTMYVTPDEKLIESLKNND